jgi:hypothetical protein
VLRLPDTPELLYALKLIKHPRLLTVQKGRDVFKGSLGRLDDLDAIRTDSDAQHPRGTRLHHAIVDAAPAKLNLVVGGCLHDVRSSIRFGKFA